MQRYQKIIVVVLLVTLVMGQFNCATILDGAKKPHERTSEIQWGYVVLDVLFTGLLGIIIDFADGAIYKSSNPSKTEIEKNLNKGIPCYRLRDDGLYKIELIDGQLKESKVEQSVIPPVVWQTIEKVKSGNTRMVLVPQYGR